MISKLLKQSDLVMAVAILAVVVMLILPVPAWLLDAMLVISIGSSVSIALIATNVSNPTQFSTFPSVLLLTTLLRLALSIAATKLILTSGESGHVIQTFGEFVMGGDFIVGLVAFLILVIVQFVVITNGAGRVAEVVARFTLDAMPGKQMSIDADLNAGLITEAEAKKRRKEIKHESDFYGSMDGASKFIKGDAIAAILIIVVNIIGGLLLGFMRGQGDVMEILKTYATLSVGEGLVSQIPALLVSTSAGLMVTRGGQEAGMGSSVMRQIIAQPQALLGTAIGLALLGFVPGFPTITFLMLAGAVFAFYRYSLTSAAKLALAAETGAEAPTSSAAATAPPPDGRSSPDSVLPLLNVDAIEFEVGYGLTRIVDPRQGGDLPARITAIRRQLALELGFVLPSVRIRDNVQLGPNEYVIRIRGEEVARANAYPDQALAIDSGSVINPIIGTLTKDPVFNIDALWIERGMKDQAERSGYTVIEPTAMMSTHLSEVVKAHSAELISRQDVQTLLDNVKELNSTVVEELVPAQLSVGEVQKVLQHLLRERVPIRDMVTILETLADFADRVKDPDQLGELVRASLPRTITRQYADANGKVVCLTIEPGLQKTLTDQIQQTPHGSVLALEPDKSSQIAEQVGKATEAASSASGSPPVLLCGNNLRLPMKRFLERHGVGTPVLAYNEISSSADVQFAGQVAA
ncbi:MAG: flagellar biosynthesis protein FlhA [Fimbriimonadales bacterium]